MPLSADMRVELVSIEVSLLAVLSAQKEMGRCRDHDDHTSALAIAQLRDNWTSLDWAGVLAHRAPEDRYSTEWWSVS